MWRLYREKKASKINNGKANEILTFNDKEYCRYNNITNEKHKKYIIYREKKTRISNVNSKRMHDAMNFIIKDSK